MMVRGGSVARLLGSVVSFADTVPALAILGVTILLEVAAASVAVTATIIPTSNTTADSVLSTLSAFDASTLSAALNVTVESLDPPVSSMQVFGPATPPPSAPPTAGAILADYAVGIIIAS